MSETGNLGLPLLAAAQAQKHVTVNQSLRTLDALVQLAVLDRNLTAPPGSPAEGNRYIVASPATGVWAGKENQIAARQDGAWVYHTPDPGWLAWVTDESALIAWSGSAWVDVIAAIGALQNLLLLGIGTTADATNPFSAKLNKALWTAKTAAEGGDGDLRYTLNKETAGDVLSLLFQSGFSLRAEVGLLGNDDFTFKVSADGATFYDAFKIAAASGVITPLPGGIAGGGRLKSQQFLSASGTWTKPDGIRKVLAFCLGAGGGGGGCTNAASSAALGGGGGAGGLSIKLIDVSAIASEPVTVGSGGTAGANTGGTGGAGGASSFGAHCSASGGMGGVGQTAGTGLVAIKGGVGGAGANGDYNMSGAPGAPGIRLSGAQGISGAGAPGYFGGGAIGNNGNAAGNAGNTPGSGASGASTNGSAAQAGGIGAAGLVWLLEFE